MDCAAPASALLVGAGYGDITAWFAAAGVSTPIASWGEGPTPSPDALLDYAIVVVDDYHIPQQWIAELARERATYVVDDWLRPDVCATGLVNPNIGARREDYSSASVDSYFTGPEFALIRPEVQALTRGRALSRTVMTILVTLGGTEVTTLAGEVVETLLACRSLCIDARITIVGGRQLNERSLRSACAGHRVQVLREPPHFEKLCSEADLVICGASTTSHELAYLGLPFIPIAFAANQRPVARGWREADVSVGVDTYNENWRNLLQDDLELMLSSADVREARGTRAMSYVDGSGPQRLLASWAIR